MKKGSLKVAEYLIRINRLVDALTYSGLCLSKEDHILYILSGLGSDYNALVVLVTSKKESYTIAEISSLLLTNEKLLEQQAAQLNKNSNAMLTIGTNSNQPKRFNGNTQGRFNNNNRGNAGFNRGGSVSRGRERGKSSFNRPQCQLCGRFDHTVFKCYHRFDRNFQQPQTG